MNDISKTLKILNDLNGGNVFCVNDDDFLPFGKVLCGYDFDDVIKYMNDSTDIPHSGNVYVPSVADMEKLPVARKISACVYGGMPIQVGYCNGRNTTYNGFEYHKGSEINIALCDLCLVLGHSYDIKDNSYSVDSAKIFFVPKGTAIELYQTTLHLSPCRLDDNGFKAVVILPKGTNTPLDEKIQVKGDKESELLLMKNKWVIAHPDREPLIKQGAYPGLKGENKEVKYR